jgi:hypothetical protein
MPPTPPSFTGAAFANNIGKAKKVALTACMRKLLTILNAMMKYRTPWGQQAPPAA